jgi:hypothetical protein
MRGALTVEPKLVVVADGVDDERVPVPPSDRVPKPAWEEIIIIRVLTASMKTCR